MVLPFYFPASLILRLRVRRGKEPSGGRVLRLIQIRLTASSLDKLRQLVNTIRGSNRQFKLHKRGQLFIGATAERLFLVCVRY
jgi:hypothetical protein